MKLKYSIQNESAQIDFNVCPETGSLIIGADSLEFEVPHKIAIELIEVLRSKLYDHQLESESLLKRLFK